MQKFTNEEIDPHLHIKWRARLKKRRGKTFNPVAIRELNLIAMMDMLTILLVFLLKSYSVSAVAIPIGEEMSVPISNNIIRPPEAVKITVTKTTEETPGVIAVDEDRVLQLDDKTMKQLQKQARKRRFLIKELNQALRKKAEDMKFIAKNNPNVKFEGKVLVIADKDSPYWLITQVLFSAAEAQFDQYNLVAMREQQE